MLNLFRIIQTSTKEEKQEGEKYGYVVECCVEINVYMLMVR